MSNLLFIRRSLQIRHAAIMEARKARAMPAGSERNAARQRARGLKELAQAEAWLEGQSSPVSQGFVPGRSVERSVIAFGVSDVR